MSGSFALTDRLTVKGAYGQYHQFVSRVVNENVTEGSRAVRRLLARLGSAPGQPAPTSGRAQPESCRIFGNTHVAPLAHRLPTCGETHPL